MHFLPASQRNAVHLEPPRALRVSATGSIVCIVRGPPLSPPPARRAADAEYAAWEDGCTPAAVQPGSKSSGTLKPPSDPYAPGACEGRSARNLVFNLCGTVNRPIAPITCQNAGSPTAATCYQQPPPLPYARGIALQYENYRDENDPAYTSLGPVCVNMESCDQCVPCRTPAHVAPTL